jgi:histidine ammonia-lyase
MRARSILQAALCATALTVHAFKGRVCHFHPSISKAKPFSGQAYVARCLKHLLATKGDVRALEDDGPYALQDPYSVRCTPQIVGVLCDSLAWIERWVEIETNSSNDNPIFDLVTGEPLMSGNFYGGHIAFAMDALKAALASVADMADRQILLLVHPQFNRGLPEDLVGVGGDEHFFNHGFKAMSISASALAAETLKNTMPAASFSRSSESHNQDKVSMGTIAARDARRACELVERVLAIHLLAAAQACQLRGNLQMRPRLQSLVKSIRLVSPHLVQDRPLDTDIEAMVQAIGSRELFSVLEGVQKL